MMTVAGATSSIKSQWLADIAVTVHADPKPMSHLQEPDNIFLVLTHNVSFELWTQLRERMPLSESAKSAGNRHVQENPISVWGKRTRQKYLARKWCSTIYGIIYNYLFVMSALFSEVYTIPEDMEKW